MTKAERIKHLASKGLKRTEIAERLNTPYSYVCTVIKRTSPFCFNWEADKSCTTKQQIIYREARRAMNFFLPLTKTRYRWYWKGFDKAKCRAGVCSWDLTRKTGGISLSLCWSLHNDYPQIADTILHEIAHALDVEQRGCSPHDQHWQDIAIKIGCDGKRYYDEQYVVPPSYTYECNYCGTQYPRYNRIVQPRLCSVCSDEGVEHDSLITLKLSTTFT